MTTDTLVQPTTPEEQAQVDHGEHLIWRLVGSKIVTFGANVDGEIFLCTEKEGKILELVIGKDEDGEISLYEIERKPEGVPA